MKTEEKGQRDPIGSQDSGVPKSNSSHSRTQSALRMKTEEKDQAKENPTGCPGLKIIRTALHPDLSKKLPREASQTICPDTPLDPDLWKMLPSELMDIALSKSPFSSLMKFRGVSKHWKSVTVPRAARVGRARGPTLLLCQPRYDSLNPSGPVQLLWLPCSSRMSKAEPAQTNESEHWTQPAHTVKSKPWLQPSHAFEPGCLLQGLFSDHVDRRLVFSEGGLLFFASREVNGWKKLLLVWNPLTQKRKVLDIPSTLIDSHNNFLTPPHVGAVVNAETGNYKLVVAVNLHTFSKVALLTDCLKDSFKATLLYDSSLDSWKRTHCIPQSETRRRDVVRGVVSYKDDIYFELTSLLDTSLLDTREVSEVLKFDVRNETWSEMREIVNDFYKVDIHRLSLTSENSNHNGQIRLFTEFTGHRPWRMASSMTESAHPKKVHCIGFDPDSLTDSKLRKTMHRFFLDHNPEVMAGDHAIEYFGIRQENAFYHVIYLRNTEDEAGDEDSDEDQDDEQLVSDTDDDFDKEQLDTPGKGVGVVVHESGEHLDTRLHDVGVVVHELDKHSDTRFYMKERLRNGIVYDFYALSPSLTALV